MVINTRKYVKKNVFPVSLININRFVKGNQKNYFPISLMNLAKEVGEAQGAIINLGNIGKEVGNQAAFINGFNYAKKVGGSQLAIANLGNIGKEVRNQAAFINGFNYAEKAGSQWASINVFNYAKEVRENQGAFIFTLINYSHKARMQKNALINITKHTGTKQKGIINYAPLTGINFWKDLPSKIESARDKLENKYKSLDDLFEGGIIEDLANRKPSLMKRIFNYNTEKDLLFREARKYLKSQEKEKAMIKKKSKQA